MNGVVGTGEAKHVHYKLTAIIRTNQLPYKFVITIA